MLKRTIASTIKEYFDKNPNKDITQSEVVDYVYTFFPKSRDTWRGVRKLYEHGYLIQVRKGVYRRKPGYQGQVSDDPFPPEVKEAIFKRDNYHCVFCDNGNHNGFLIHADHIIPKHKGGKSTLENGQTLCSEHNMLKKNYGTLYFLKKYSEKMFAKSIQLKDKKTEQFFKDILEVIKKHEKKG